MGHVEIETPVQATRTDVLNQRLIATSTRVREGITRWRERWDGTEPLAATSEQFGRPEAAPAPARSVDLGLPLALLRSWATAAGDSEIGLVTPLVAIAGFLTAHYHRRDDTFVALASATANGDVLPVRVPVPGGHDCPTWLSRTADEVVAALQDATYLPDDLAALARTAMVVSVSETAARRCGGELAVVVYRHADHVRLRLLFDPGRVGDALAARIAGHLEAAVRGLLEPHPLGPFDIDLLTPAEREQLRFLIGPDDPSWPEPSLFPEQVRRNAEMRPDAPALVFEQQRLTYGEMVAAADSLGAQLQHAGARPGDRVALLFERGTLPVLAALACLFRGFCYVPVDSSQPAERVRFVIDDCQAAIVFTQAGLVDRVPPQCDDRVLVADPDHAASAPSSEPVATDIAYAMYTSGSTGVPKAVAVSHASYAATCDAYSRTLDLRTSEHLVCLQLASFAFDVFNGDLGRSLYQGGMLVICPDDLRGDPAAIAGLVCRYDVTVVEATPAVMNPLAAQLAKIGVPQSLRVLLCGSDSWASSDGAAVRDHVGAGVQVYNTYGVTEAAIDSAYYAVAEPIPAIPTVPIGRPLPRVRLHVVDHRLREVPPGLPGELCIAGAAVSDGYLHRAELTAERFASDPFGFGRLYRTGDLVRLRGDGSLEFLGRIDNQVKVNGVRIEPGEIEHVLRRHPLVTDAVVVVRDTGSGGRLVAYVEAPGARPDPSDLRAMCRMSLADQLVPAAVVALPRLPLSPNRKVDRSALPEPKVGSEVAYVAPRSELEQIVSSVWAAVLGVERVGTDDDFFASGGHSLLATRVLGRLDELVGVRLPMRTLFDAPTVAGVAAALAKSRSALRRPPVLAAPPTGDRIEASAAQARLWFLEQMDPGSTVHTVPVVLRLTGDLDPAALGRCLDEWVSRHEALRTVFRDVDGTPLQVVLDAAAVPLPQSDLRGDKAADTLPDEVAPVREMLDQAFDVATGPLLRACLVRLADDVHILAVAIHHLACDGTSVSTMLRELGELYPLARAGKLPLERPVGLRYADFSSWQSAELESSRAAADLAFWREQLATVPDLELPYDGPRGPGSVRPGASVTRILPSADIERFAQERGVTVFMTLLAAFEVALARWCGQKRFAVGTVTSGRSLPEFDDVVGFFVNTVALPADLSGRRSFGDLLGNVRQVVLDAYDHQDVPFDRIVSELSRSGNPDAPPVFQACLTIEDLRGGLTTMGDVAVEEFAPEQRTSRFDLTLNVLVRDGEYQLTTVYASDLFERETMHRFQRSFCTLLAAALTQPEADVSGLPAVHPRDLAQLAEWGRGPESDRVPGSLHGPVLDWAQRAPARTALIDGDRVISYGELVGGVLATADQLCRQLTRRESELTVVAICLPRGAELITAILAVLAAGCAYLPVEPDLPTERARQLVQDSDSRAVVTDSESAERFAAIGIPLVSVAAFTATFSPPAPPPGRDWTREAAYVMYTSGSTGDPKGIIVPHAAVDNRLSWGEHEYPNAGGERFLHKTPYGFDVSVVEIFWPLRTGCPLVIAEPGGHRDPSYLADLIVEANVTTVHFVPSMLEAFLNEPAAAECRGVLRRVFCSGEALPQALLPRTRSVLGLSVHNLYGPTETGIEVTAWDSGAHPDEPVSIGRPVRNSWVRVLDPGLNEVPVGAPGELFVGGAQLALGYLGRPDLTADKFMIDSKRDRIGRMYRTGDLVRWSATGQLRYLGRTDTQVKIDGRRVELAEIAAVLERRLDIAAAAAIFRPEQPASARLVAYYVPAGAGPADDLREWLRHRLPNYMVPSAFVPLERFPLTRNGKLDRDALAVPSVADLNTGYAYVAPRPGLEETIATIWAEVLGVDRVGVHDDFFAMGGHSLLATQLVARLRESTGIRLPVRAVFDEPSVAALARELDSAGADPAQRRPAPRRYDRSAFRRPTTAGDQP